MRSSVVAALILAAAAIPATAQSTQVQPKPAAAAPATQTPLDTLKALAQGERQSMQSDLAWTGKYNGNINGEASDRLVNAIKAFQTDRKSKPTGVLNPQEREQLAAAAKKLQTAVGWKLLGDARSGVRLGLPTRLVPQQSSDANGPQWSSASGAIRVAVTRRQQPDISTAIVAAQLRAEPAGRKVTYSTVKPDFFVLSGTQQDEKIFYVRGQLRGDEVRILSIVYDPASKAVMEPVVIAMSSAFTPFPTGAQAVGPPPRKSVEYATGIVVNTTGFIVTDRQAVEGCQSIIIAGHGNADKAAEHKARDLALLRIYGARDLAALALGTGAAKSDVTLTGIADPQNQGGGSAVSTTSATVASGGNGELTLSPAPGLGFSGAAALDADGAFAGMAQLKPVVVAGPSTATPATQAVLVGANAVRDFLKTNKVAANGTSKSAKAAMVRVICVRK